VIIPSFKAGIISFIKKIVSSGPSEPSGKLYMWGSNQNYGQLGLGDSFGNRSSPVQVGTDTDWSKISTGSFSSAAIKSNGTLWVWGSNLFGQLGLGNTTSRSSPVQLGSDTNWSKITVGHSYMFAIKTNGTLWAWGNNGSGQLGLGNTTNRSSPVQVGTGTDWSSVAVTGYLYIGFFIYNRGSSTAIKTNGTLWAWGSNDIGELGLGNAGYGTERSSPVQVGTGTDWSDVEGVGGINTPSFHATKTNGTLWAWGSNDRGRLGIGTYGFGTERSSPVQVGTDNTWLLNATNLTTGGNTDNYRCVGAIRT